VVRERDPELLRRPSRLRALAELEANAESSAQALDRIARTACRVLDVPVVLVNLVGAEQQRFVGCEGPEPWPSTREMPITAGFCPFTIAGNDAYTLADARVDPDSATNPAVEQFGVVAYAGVPLRTTDGEPVGTLCAIDYAPRTWSAEDLGLLTDFGAGVIAELQVLAATRRVARHQAGVRELTELAHALTTQDVQDAVLPVLARHGATGLTRVAPDEAERLSAAAAAGEPVAVLPLDGELAVSFAGERTFTDDDRAHLAAVGAIVALAG
jgi:GAF domain-containing protein